MRHRRGFAVITLCGALAAGAAYQPESTKPQSPPGHEASALAPVAFLSGTWRGGHDGDFLEEVWSDPQGSHIMGCFRWMDKQRNPVMLELLTLSRDGEDIVLRLRHFDAKMTPWPSEADGPITLRLDSSEPHRAVFRGVSGEQRLRGVTYELPSPGELKISIEFREGSGREPLVLTLQRAKQN